MLQTARDSGPSWLTHSQRSLPDFIARQSAGTEVATELPARSTANLRATLTITSIICISERIWIAYTLLFTISKSTRKPNISTQANTSEFGTESRRTFDHSAD